MTNRLYRNTGIRRVSTWVPDPVYVTGPIRGTRPKNYKPPKKAPEPEPSFEAGPGSPTTHPFLGGGEATGEGFGSLRPPL